MRHFWSTKGDRAGEVVVEEAYGNEDVEQEQDDEDEGEEEDEEEEEENEDGEDEEEDEGPGAGQESSRSRKRKSEEYGESIEEDPKAKKQMREEIFNTGLPYVSNGETGIGDSGIPYGRKAPTVMGDWNIPYNPDKVIRENADPTTHVNKGKHVDRRKNLVKVADLQKMPPPPLPLQRGSTPGPSNARKRGSPGNADDPSALKRKPQTRRFSIFHTINASYDHRHGPPPAMTMGSLGIPFDPAAVSDGEDDEDDEDDEDFDGEEGVAIGQSSEDDAEAARQAPEMSMFTSSFRHCTPDVLDSSVPPHDEEEAAEEGVAIGQSSEGDAEAAGQAPEMNGLTSGFRHGTPDVVLNSLVLSHEEEEEAENEDDAEPEHEASEMSMLASGFRHDTPDVVLDSLVPSDDEEESEDEEEGVEQGGPSLRSDEDAEYELDD
ncbi:hypothetical protein BST61_g3455 [Cercospora zeina]